MSETVVLRLFCVSVLLIDGHRLIIHSFNDIKAAMSHYKSFSHEL